MTEDAGGVIREAFPHAAGGLKQYVDVLLDRGIEWGLLGPREGERVWQRHVGNSLALLDVLPQGVFVADVGSGAGLPGLPIAIARPDLQVCLVEPLLRRSQFLELAVAELGLADRVSVVRARAEEISERFDVVTCRAVAPLSKLLRWTLGLFEGGGQLVALKGASAEAEVEAAGKVLRKASLTAEVLELRAAPGVEPTRAIRVR